MKGRTGNKRKQENKDKKTEPGGKARRKILVMVNYRNKKSLNLYIHQEKFRGYMISRNKNPFAAVSVGLSFTSTCSLVART